MIRIGIAILCILIQGMVFAQSARDLPLPVVPDSLRVPADRADFIISHFWDAMDFSDKELSADTVFIEQNFANYINLFPHAHYEKLQECVNSLMNETDDNPGLAKLIYSIADKYLSEYDSPFRDDAYHILFLKNASESPLLDETTRARAAFMYDMENRNLPGSQAPDFTFIDKDGGKSSLKEVKVKENLLLIFFDPSCDHCVSVIKRLTESLPESVTDVLAIDISQDKDLRDEARRILPESWLLGYSSDGFQDSDVYILDDTPTIYLLDKYHKILIKNATPVTLGCVPTKTNLSVPPGTK